jgi:hypothetical protein
MLLLFVGAFLLLVSALILVAYNWASFHPLLQWSLIAGVCASFWGGGIWVGRRPGLQQAGIGLQAVGGVLVPVVWFALSRPGIFDLEPRYGWLLASLLSLPIYALATLRLRHMLFLAAGCLAALSTTLAAANLLVGVAWFFPVALLTLVAFLPLARWLQHHSTLQALERVPRYAAHAGVPLALLLALAWHQIGSSSLAALTAAFWVGAGFYLLATWLERAPRWLAVSAALLPLALLITLDALAVAANWWGLALLLAFTALLLLAHWLQQQAQPAFATVLRYAAHAGVPLALLLALAGFVPGTVTVGFLAATLWAGTGFYLLAAWLERAPRWLWGFHGLLPLATLPTLHALSVAPQWWWLALACLALAYLGLSAAWEPRIRPYAPSGYAGAALLAGGVLLALPGTWLSGDEVAVRWTLPFVLATAAGVPLAYQRARLAFLDERQRVLAAVSGLVLAGVLLPLWMLSLLNLTTLSIAQQGVLLLVLAILYACAAYWWPGRLHRRYAAALQILATMLAVFAGAFTLSSTDTWVVGMLLLTGFWALQTVLYRQSVWAALALGNALFAAGVFLLDQELWLVEHLATWGWVGVTFAIVYQVNATLLRHSRWRCLTWPGTGWGVVVHALVLLVVALDMLFFAGRVELYHVGQAGLLTGLLVLLSWLWRRPWIGWPAAVHGYVLALMVLSRGFFTAWEPDSFGYAYALCGLALLFLLIGQGVRHLSARYAVAYEIVGYAPLVLVPLIAASGAMHATLTWIALALLYGLATWLYRLPWLLAPAFIAADFALLRGAGWLYPGGDPAGAGIIWLVATWVQALAGLGAHWWERGQSARPITQQHFSAAYAAALLTGAGAVALASSSGSTLTVVLFALAALVALLATLERQTAGAWGALVLFAWGVYSLLDTLHVAAAWSLTWGTVAALALCLLGWGIERFVPNATWRQPLFYGPLVAATLLLGVLALTTSTLPPLTVALVVYALLLVTLSVRERTMLYSYVAGASLVAALLCQFYDWEVRQLQWYVVPSGIYLLALAEGLRRFQQQRRVSQVVETGALLLMLGTTLMQSLTTEGIESQLYAVALCCESLVVLGYGTLRKLRVPFGGGGVFFVLGVLWLSVDPIQATNKWIVLGGVGMLMVGIYVLLEQRQEQLLRVGRAWAERLQYWN